jgi:predicted NBD/HSP70 family sugar kinase
MESPHFSTPVPAAAIAPSLLRTMNQRFLLDWLYTHGPNTRPQLARDAGLSQPTVFSTLANLELAGLVRPTKKSDEAGGRPALVYEADPTAGSIMAIDIEAERLRVVVADLNGRELSRVEAKVSARAVKTFADKFAELSAEAASKAGVGLAAITCGVVSARAGAAHLVDAVRIASGFDLAVENDFNLAALGEFAEGVGTGTSPFVYLHIGATVGLGLIVDGRVYRGYSGMAGQIGALPTEVAGSEDHGSRALSGALAADAVVAYARDEGMAGTLRAEKVYRDARDGSESARAAIRRQTDVLARLLANLTVILDPELIVIGGGVGHNLDVIGIGLADRLAELSPRVPRIAVSALGSEATLRGAIVHGKGLAREREFARRLSPEASPVEALEQIS